MGRSTSTVSGRPDGKVENICSIDGQNGLITYAIPNSKTPTYKHQEEVKRNLVDGYIENGVELYSGLQLYSDTSSATAVLVDIDITSALTGSKILFQQLDGSFEVREIATEPYYIEGSGYRTDVSIPYTRLIWQTIIIITKSPYLATMGTHTHTSIIGDPANYPSSMKSVLASGRGIGFMDALLVGE